MKKYRKKPVVVGVMRFGVSARSQRLCKEFIGNDWVDKVPIISPMHENKPGIRTLEGIMAIDVGEFIIKGVEG